MVAAIYPAIRLAVRGTSYGQDIVNIFHVPSTVGIVVAANTVGNSWQTNMASVLPGDYHFADVYAIDMSSAGGATFTWSFPSAGTGSAPATAEVGLAAIAVWVDTVAGRGSRSCRSYIGPVPSSWLDVGGQALLPARVTTYQTAVSAFLAGCSPTAPLRTVHGLHSGSPSVSAVLDVTVPPNRAHLDSRRD